MSREIYTQAANPNPYAPQPSYAGSPPFQAPQDPYESSLPLHQQYRYTPEPQSEHHQSPPEKQRSMNVQHPQATYQQQPGPMSYNNAEKGAPPPQGYHPGYNGAQPPPQQVQQGYGPGYNGAQPAPQQGMYAGPPPGGKPLDGNGEREWSHDLFDCFGDCGTCCLACFCPCFVYGQVKQRIDHLQKTGSPDPEYGGSGCGGSCCAYGTVAAVVGLGWIFQIGTRSAIRARYRIRGGGCTDCMAAWCCHSCDLTQESRELDVEERHHRQ